MYIYLLHIVQILLADGLSKDIVTAIECCIEIEMSRFAHQMDTNTCSTLLLEFCKGLHMHSIRY